MIINTFLKLPSPEKILIFKALIYQWLVRIMLWVLPFSFIQRKVNKNINFTDNPTVPLEKVIWAVNATSRYIPRSTCLTRALTSKILLDRYHYSTTIMIGVSKNEGEFEAHAWLEYEGEIVLGESEKDYIPLLNLNQNE